MGRTVGSITRPLLCRAPRSLRSLMQTDASIKATRNASERANHYASQCARVARSADRSIYRSEVYASRVSYVRVRLCAAQLRPRLELELGSESELEIELRLCKIPHTFH